LDFHKERKCRNIKVRWKLTVALYVYQDRKFVSWGFMSEETLISVRDSLISKSRAVKVVLSKAQCFISPELV
jgi:hypothetical protein